MKITFVYPDILMHRRDWPGYFYVGVASLSAVLKQAGHETSLIHVTRPIGRREFLDRVRRADPDLLGFSATSHMAPFVRQYCGWLVEAGSRVRTICGGVHATIAPEETLGYPGLDMICRGEGERSLLELVARLAAHEDVRDTPGVWLRHGGDLVRNEPAPLVADLDELPFPDRTIFDYESLYGEREGRASFMVSRGCPYNCSYCCNHLQRSIYGAGARRARFRSVQNVVAEIEQVRSRYSFIRSLIFDDDVLILRRDWAEEFGRAYAQRVGLPFICNARANLTDAETADLLKRAGCRHVKFGVESGNEHIVNDILKRQLTNDQVRAAFTHCRAAGLTVESFNMLGVPDDTPATVLDTIKLNAELGVDHMQVTIFQPYRGTALAELCRARGYIGEEDLGSDFFSPSIVRLDTLSAQQTLMFRDYFKILVRYYQVLRWLPRGVRGAAMRISDAVLSRELVARALNAAYRPLDVPFRALQALYTAWRARRLGCVRICQCPQ